jgi:dihydropteroate synthase
MSLKIRHQIFDWGKKTYLMGILNVTPDSFSDGGRFNTLESAVAQAEIMLENGVDIIDIGGQSTRPGAEEVSLTEELKRIVPIIIQLRRSTSIPISIDTTKAAVAKEAIALGADLVNDISGGTFDPEMLPTVGKLNVPIVLMHIRGTPQTMQQLTEYDDLVGELIEFFQLQIDRAIACGISRENIIIDPGIGFAKTPRQSIELIQRLGEFKSLDLPLLVGVSRKSFMKEILNKNNPQERVWGTAAACCSAIAFGADILRVHDLPEMYDVSRVADAIWRKA